MPSEADHVNLANRCQQVLDHLRNSDDGFADWVTVTASYRALHIVEAVLANDKHLHGQTHQRRHELLKRNYPDIWINYRPLYAASRVARYLAETSHGRVYGSFSDYMPTKGVKAQLLDTRLQQIERDSEPFLSKKAYKALKHAQEN